MKKFSLILFSTVISTIANGAEVVDPVPFDVNHDKKFSRAEAEAWQTANDEAALAKLRKEQTAVRSIYIDYWENRPIAEAALLLKPKADPCAGVQTIFIRRSRLETFQFRKDADSISPRGFKPRKDATGAAVSFSRDQLADTQVLSVNGRLSAILAQRDPTSPCEAIRGPKPDGTGAFSFFAAAWIEGQGSVNRPPKKGEQSALQAGLDFQWQLYGADPVNFHYLIVSPYALSDLRGDASGYGVKFGWEPTATALRLGGRDEIPNPYFDWFWVFRGEADVRTVDKVGFTSLVPGEYSWLGVYATYKFFLFPSLGEYQGRLDLPFPDLADRIFGSLSAQYHWDANSGIDVHKYGVEVGYNLTKDGFTALSFQYTNGTDKDNFASTQKYQVNLNVKY